MGGTGKKRSELAVSPVIGVMLMLVITVLLAAAVSSFTGGLKAQKPAPTANFEVKIVKNGTSGSMGVECSYIQITEVSGDRIPTKDLEIITYNPDAYGQKIMVVKPNSMNTHFYFSSSITWGKITVSNGTSSVKVPITWASAGWVNGTSPYLNNVAYGYFGRRLISKTYIVVLKTGTTVTGTYNATLNEVIIPSAYNVTDVTGVTIQNAWKPDNPKVDFGNYTIHPGITMTADWYSNYPQAKWNGYSYSGANVTGFCACIADGWNVTPGHYITVKIVYTPTHTVIWEKKVLVEGEGI